MAPGLAPTLALASGVPMALLGAWLLALEPRRSEQVFFGLFSIAWGLLVVAANLGLVFDSATVFESAYLVHFALLPPATLFLAHFTARLHGGRWSRLVSVGAGLVAAVAAVTLVTDAGAVLAEVTTGADGGLGAVELGPAAFPLFFIPFFGVFYVTLAVLYGRYRSAEPGSPRHQYRGMLAGLALYTSYQTVTNLIGFLGIRDPVPLPTRLGEFLSQSLFVAGTLLLAGIVAHLVLRPTDPGERDLPLLAAFLVPAGVALVTELWSAIPTAARTWGLWRVLMVAVLVHAIARYRLFDLDLKLKRWAAPGLAAGAVGLAGLVALVQVANTGDVQSTVEPALTGFALAGALLVQRERVGRALFPSAREDEAYLDQRKREVYRAALEGVVADGDDPDRDPVLADLRERMGISGEAHETMVAQLRKPGSVADGGLPPIEPGATVADRYHVDRLIGEGAHGRAFLAFDDERDAEVVLKVVGKPVLGGEAVRGLLREAEIMASIDDPHVLDVHEVVEGRHEVVLVTEYAAGGNLADLVARKGRLGLDRSLTIADQVLQALEAAHAQDVVHRDVKPENVLLADEEVRVADFGVAKRDRQGDTALTAGPVGTLLYMSPEQVRGDAVDERSDLYAVGVLLHRILTGGFYIPTRGADDFTLRQRILEETPRLDLDEAPPALVDLLGTALAKDPDERFASAAEMRDALREVPRAAPRAAARA